MVGDLLSFSASRVRLAKMGWQYMIDTPTRERLGGIHVRGCAAGARTSVRIQLLLIRWLSDAVPAPRKQVKTKGRRSTELRCAAPIWAAISGQLGGGQFYTDSDPRMGAVCQ
jgi:hypothetical protein